MKYSTLLVVVIGSLFACTVQPAEMYYGTDACHFCSMTIVDKSHASQYVTDKGKSYKFDAIECLVNELKTVDSSTLEFILVADYLNPGVLIDARTAHYLVHPQVPSPMGENLSAFKDEASMEPINVEKLGEVYTWETLKLSNE